MRVAELAGAAGVLLVAALPSGCGQDVRALPDHLAGHEVGVMAERELETENPALAPGTLVCPDLDLRVGAEVRCLRTAELSGGRVVKVRGTVAVTSLTAGGQLHVRMDVDPAEVGVASGRLDAEVRQWYAERSRVAPSRVSCPYLRAEVGHRVTCHLDVAGVDHDVDVVVTAVDAATYRTTYVVRGQHGSS